jgi:outer membrane protein assembly factor BamB
MWGPTASQHYLAIYGTSTAIANGKLYECYMSGIVYCYDIKTGQILWTYDVVDPLNEILWGENWPMRIVFVAADKIYLVESEHSPNQPLPRGAPIVCLNATTGGRIWQSINNYYYRTNVIMADNIIALMSMYDQQIYAIGKGPSATTIQAPGASIDFGKSVVLSGMVTDISPGTMEYERVSRFPNGVPAVSDESESAWMEYVYMQMPRPTDVTGVSVSINVLDANGNYRNIGTTTTDANGFYSLQWTPDISGKYTVIATFAGTNGYYGSSAEAAFAVDEPALTPAPTQAVQISLADQYFMPAVVGIIIAIFIAAAAIVLVLRKK